MRLSDHLYLIGSGDFGLSHEFDCNVYVLDSGKELVMIDTGAGCNVPLLINNLTRDGLNLEHKHLGKILLTHGHADHAGGAYELRQRYGCEVYVGEQEVGVVEHGGEKDLGLDVAKKSGFYSPDYMFKNCKVSKSVKHGDIIRSGDLEIYALNIPGHSPGSICYLVQLPEGKALFTGDVVFAKGVIGLLNCDGSSLSDYRKYIHRLRGLNVDMLLPGHGCFVMANGQKHIELAIKALELLPPPKNFI